MSVSGIFFYFGFSYLLQFETQFVHYGGYCPYRWHLPRIIPDVFN